MTDDTQKRILADNLKFYIKKTGKEQLQIANELNINPTTFNMWVNGKNIPKVSILRKIADYFHVTLIDLVDEHDPIHYLSPQDKLKAIPPEVITDEIIDLIKAYYFAPPHQKQTICDLLNISKPEGVQKSSTSENISA